MTINHLEIVVTGLLVDLEEGDEGGAGELEGGDYFDRGGGRFVWIGRCGGKSGKRMVVSG